jgi:hypothetical protein
LCEGALVFVLLLFNPFELVSFKKRSNRSVLDVPEAPDASNQPSMLPTRQNQT